MHVYHTIMSALKDHRGDTHLANMILILIGFIAGGILLAGIASALVREFGPGMDWAVHNFMN